MVLGVYFRSHFKPMNSVENDVSVDLVGAMILAVFECMNQRFSPEALSR